jgi:hypothetical protein
LAADENAKQPTKEESIDESTTPTPREILFVLYEDSVSVQGFTETLKRMASI